MKKKVFNCLVFLFFILILFVNGIDSVQSSISQDKNLGDVFSKSSILTPNVFSFSEENLGNLQDFLLKTIKQDNNSFFVVHFIGNSSDYLNKKVYFFYNSSFSGVCINMVDKNGPEIFRGNCVFLECPGFKGNYFCEKKRDKIVLSGLKDSGVIPIIQNICGDGICTDSENSDSCSGDCPSENTKIESNKSFFDLKYSDSKFEKIRIFLFFLFLILFIYSGYYLFNVLYKKNSS